MLKPPETKELTSVATAQLPAYCDHPDRLLHLLFQSLCHFPSAWQHHQSVSPMLSLRCF